MKLTQSGTAVKGKMNRRLCEVALPSDSRTKLCCEINCEKLIREADFYTRFYYAGWSNFKLEWWTIFRLTNTVNTVCVATYIVHHLANIANNKIYYNINAVTFTIDYVH